MVQVFWGFDPHLLEVTTAEFFNSINIYLPSHPYVPSKKKRGKPKKRMAGSVSSMCCELLSNFQVSLATCPTCLPLTYGISAGCGFVSPRVSPHHPHPLNPGLWTLTLMSNYQVPGHLQSLLISSLLSDHGSRKPQRAPSPAAWNFIWLWRPDNLERIQPCAQALKPFVVKGSGCANG